MRAVLIVNRGQHADYEGLVILSDSHSCYSGTDGERPARRDRRAAEARRPALYAQPPGARGDPPRHEAAAGDPGHPPREAGAPAELRIPEPHGAGALPRRPPRHHGGGLRALRACRGSDRAPPPPRVFQLREGGGRPDLLTPRAEPGTGARHRRGSRGFHDREPPAPPRRNLPQLRVGAAQPSSPGKGSFNEVSTCSAPAAWRSSTEYFPLATPTHRTSAACAASTSRGVSPTTITSSRPSGSSWSSDARRTATRISSPRSRASDPYPPKTKYRLRFAGASFVRAAPSIAPETIPRVTPASESRWSVSTAPSRTRYPGEVQMSSER